MLLAAGLPALQKANQGHRVAVERVLRGGRTGLFYGDADDAADVLADEVGTRRASAAALDARHRHTFDTHVDALVHVLRRAVTT